MNQRFLGFLAFFGFLGFAVPASAEIVHLTSGRTMSVAGHRIDGDLAFLSLRSGGEMSMPKGLIAKVTADEVPWVPPARLTVSAPNVPNLPNLPDDTVEVPFEVLIAKAAEAHDVDPNLVRAMITVESAYRVKARSHKGAMGLMQLMPATAREYGVRNAYDPAENINAGVKHLKSLLDRFDLRVAVAAYNAGEGAVRRYGGIPPYAETRSYVNKVMTLAGITGH